MATPPNVFGSSLLGSADLARAVVNQDEENFSFYVRVFEIVPLKFRRLHAVADENQVGVNRGIFRDALGPGHELVLKFRFQRAPVTRQRELHVGIRSDAHERQRSANRFRPGCPAPDPPSGTGSSRYLIVSCSPFDPGPPPLKFIEERTRM